jgi:hypothetical protein
LLGDPLAKFQRVVAFDERNSHLPTGRLDHFAEIAARIPPEDAGAGAFGGGEVLAEDLLGLFLQGVAGVDSLRHFSIGR